MKLYIGNKTYSSWSMRPWVLMRALHIAFEEVFVPFDGFGPDAEFKKTMAALHPLATVPVLEHDGLIIADTQAITEYMAETYPTAGIWPSDKRDRAIARQLVAAMHSGFAGLRGHCPMNIGVDLEDIGRTLYQTHENLRNDIARLETLLTPHCENEFLFGSFSAVDAFYAPVMSRIETYCLPISDALKAYQERVLSHPAVQDWYQDAKAENIFLDFEEPYRASESEIKPL